MRFKVMAVVVVVAAVFMVDAIASAHVLETPHDYGCAPADSPWRRPRWRRAISPVSRPISTPSSAAVRATRWMTRRVWRSVQQSRL